MNGPQLRLVTVLFLDITGSTALVERLDPEDAGEVMDGALARFTAVVVQQGGRVLQYAGDNLLAAFGAERTQEDDAERAVRAGLALLAASREHAQAVQRRHGWPGFGVRVGLHTGPVLLGGGIDAEGTIRGLTVHVAARMEQTAPAGGLLISHATWRHVQGLFDATPQPALDVKGVQVPVKSWLISGAVAGAVRERSIEGWLPPFQGREAELEVLAVMHEGAASGQPRAVTLLAEAGVGKSRLLEQWQQSRSVQGQSPLLLARLQAASRLQPHALLRQWLLGFARVADSDSAAQARARFEAAMAGRIDEAAAHAVGQLIGLDYRHSAHVAALQPRALRDQGLAGFRRFLQAMASVGATAGVSPLLLIADDLHWADEASLDLLPPLLAPPLPLLMVFGARPTLLDSRPQWGADPPRHRLLRLAPLDASAGRGLAEALTARVDADASVRDALINRLVEQADGNPFYMEELVKMLIDDGVIGTGANAGASTRPACRPHACPAP